MAGTFVSKESAADHAEAERADVAAFRRRLDLTHLIDVHTHFMPERVLAKVWDHFDGGGPLVGRRWPIAYRQKEQQRLEVLRSFGVHAFTSMVYPHRPGMARWLNDWAAEFAARTPDCLHTATSRPASTSSSRSSRTRSRTREFIATTRCQFGNTRIVVSTPPGKRSESRTPDMVMSIMERVGGL
jgi:hypothetical protein